MSKFKAGDMVKVLESTSGTFEERKLVGKVCKIHAYDPEYDYSYPYKVWNEDESEWFQFKESQLELATKSWDTLQVGDVLVEGGEEQTVLAVIGGVVALSEVSEQEMLDSWRSKKSLQESGYTIKAAEEDITELTLEQIAKKFKLPVEKLRIKD